MSKRCEHPDHASCMQFGIECPGCGDQMVFGKLFRGDPVEMRQAKRLQDSR